MKKLAPNSDLPTPPPRRHRTRGQTPHEEGEDISQESEEERFISTMEQEQEQDQALRKVMVKDIRELLAEKLGNLDTKLDDQCCENRNLWKN